MRVGITENRAGWKIMLVPVDTWQLTDQVAGETLIEQVLASPPPDAMWNSALSTTSSTPATKLCGKPAQPHRPAARPGEDDPGPTDIHVGPLAAPG